MSPYTRCPCGHDCMGHSRTVNMKSRAVQYTVEQQQSKEREWQSVASHSILPQRQAAWMTSPVAIAITVEMDRGTAAVDEVHTANRIQ